jgi:sugar-phosphatase
VSVDGAGPERARIRAVIFDMDGVLIDTEPVWRRVEMGVFDSVGVHLTEDECRETMGVRIDEAVRLWYRRRPWRGDSVDVVAQRILDGVVAHVRAHGVAVDGALTAIAAVRDAGLLCAVASSSPRLLIDTVIDRLGIAGAVDAVCSAETELRGKPAPDVYLTTASLLGVPPQSCVAVEDSANGVLSARAAGMRCIAIPDGETASDPRLDAATVRVDSLRDLDRALLESLDALLVVDEALDP